MADDAAAAELRALRQEVEALRANEQRLRLMIDSVPGYAIYMLDAAGHVATWHQGIQRIEGYREDEVLGRHCSLFFTPAEIANGLPEQELAAARQRGRVASEGWRRRKDGSRFWAGTVLSAMRGEGGELLGYAKLTRDLTARKQQEDLLARIAELSPTAMLLVDGQGAIRYLNTQAEAMFGHDRESLLGQSIHQLIPMRFHAGHGQHMQLFMRDVTNRPMGVGRDLFARRKDGSEIEVEVGLSGIETSEGPAVLAAVVDVSERRRQQRALETALGEKDTLLKEVYHRVKNNLQVVQSLLSMQRRAVTDQEACTALDDSVLRVRAMALVHEQLYRAGNLAAVPLRHYSEELLQQIGLAAGATARGIRVQLVADDFETALDGAVPYGLLLAELVTNCLKHGYPDNRGGTVRVTLSQRPEGARLSVADDGQGLPAGLQLDNPRTLGLQLAVSLCRQLGGELSIVPGAGAQFAATLPRL